MLPRIHPDRMQIAFDDHCAPASSLFYWNRAWPVRLPSPISPCVNARAHRFGGFGLSRGSLGVPFIELEKALVTGPLAAQGGQRGPLTTPVGSTNPGDSTASPGNHRHNWILGKLTAARVDGMDGKELRRYAHKLHTGLVQTPGLVPHFFELAEALAIANFVAARSYSVAHQRAAGVSSGQARRAKSALRDKRILALLDKGHSIRRIAEEIGVSRRTVARVKDRQGARALR